MKTIFEQDEFSKYSNVNIYASRGIIQEQSIYSKTTTVFISHKHDDLDDLKGLIGFLENEYGVKAYIDSRDPSMPKKTSGETETGKEADASGRQCRNSSGSIHECAEIR